ncbi:MAG: LPS assembly lipoprotein LptE [Candidatus Omnitrophota bacterium]|nr:LPS assembly lipoprotein LptE [Candidatus Omnitrophota bacterium]
MKNFPAKLAWLLCSSAIICMLSGCGYTTQSLLPSDFKSIYVDNFKNSINVSAEQSDIRMYRGYRPGMEVDLTKAVRDKFLYDGNLKVANTETGADIALKSELIDYRREPLIYDAHENIEKYRMKLIINMRMENVKTGKVVWEERSFAGETDYATQGVYFKTEETAIKDTITDLARRVVERTVEAW